MISNFIKKIHFIGIGGIGMSGLAEILINQGFKVSGSDLALSEVTDHLQDLGAEIHQGHNSENLHDVDLVVYSSAVNLENPEVKEARNRKIPTIKRAERTVKQLQLQWLV